MGDLRKHSLKKTLAMALVAGLALSASADVFADHDDFRPGPGRGGIGRPGRGPGPGFPGNDRPGRGRPGRGFERESTYVGKHMNYGDRLFVGRELGLRQHVGKELERVEVRIDGRRRGGQANLIVNGQSVQTENFYGGRVGSQSLVFDLHRPLVLGENVRRLQVEFQGAAFVEEVAVIMKRGRGGHPRDRELTAHIYEDVRGHGRLSVADLVNANYRQENLNVRTVELELRNHGHRTQIRLCERNGRHEPIFIRPRIDHDFDIDFDVTIGQRPGRGHSRNCHNTQLVPGRGTHRVYLDGQGAHLGDLMLVGRGDFTIRKITVNTSRF